MSGKQEITLDKSSGHVIYKRNYTIEPFRWAIYPNKKDRFCAIIIADPEYLKSSRLFEFVFNSFVNSQIIEAENISQSLKLIIDRNDEQEKIQKQVAIFDLSIGGKFVEIRPEIIPVDSSSWHIRHQILRSLFPNWFLAHPNKNTNNNYSHTIWLASTFNEVPAVIWTHSNIAFITEPESITSYMINKLRSTNPSTVASDIIFAISNSLEQNAVLMSMPKKQLDKDDECDDIIKQL